MVICVVSEYDVRITARIAAASVVSVKFADTTATPLTLVRKETKG
jgi:hypothetical protein